MRVSEVLSFDEYYRDSRFQKKKPDVHGTWRQRCGDNMYYRDETGEWRQCRSLHHRNPQVKHQDLRHPRVFIAEHFYYFGNKAPDIPPSYADLIWRRQGCKWRHDPAVVGGFLDWLQANFEPGVLGIPYDNDEAHGCGCGQRVQGLRYEGGVNRLPRSVPKQIEDRLNQSGGLQNGQCI
jgi:hypothetical protein